MTATLVNSGHLYSSILYVEEGSVFAAAVRKDAASIMEKKHTQFSWLIAFIW